MYSEHYTVNGVTYMHCTVSRVNPGSVNCRAFSMATGEGVGSSVGKVDVGVRVMTIRVGSGITVAEVKYIHVPYNLQYKHYWYTLHTMRKYRTL